MEELPPPLLSRFEVVRVQGPKGGAHFRQIVRAAAKEFQARHAIPDGWMPSFGEAEWRWLAKHYTTARHARKAAEALIAHLMRHGDGPGFRH